MHARAFAKLNLGLRVSPMAADGYHPLQGIFQSIDLADGLWLEDADEDAMAGVGGPVPDGDANLAWKALRAVRAAAGSDRPQRLALTKRIPVAAGLGGGSSDAAASLVLAGRRFGVGSASLDEIAPDLGADVPFCLVGGTAVVSGRGERVHRRSFAAGYAVALVVPPFELSTPAVYAEWDRLGGPAGPSTGERRLPPVLRTDAPLHNDLYPAAVSLAPDLDGWRAELEDRWEGPVLMSGSGPTLYAFFVDPADAVSALDDVPAGVRAAHAAMPVPFGWVIDDGGVPITPPPVAAMPWNPGPDLREWAERLLATPLA